MSEIGSFYFCHIKVSTFAAVSIIYHQKLIQMNIRLKDVLENLEKKFLPDFIPLRPFSAFQEWEWAAWKPWIYFFNYVRFTEQIKVEIKIYFEGLNLLFFKFEIILLFLIIKVSFWIFHSWFGIIFHQRWTYIWQVELFFRCEWWEDKLYILANCLDSNL